MAEEAVSYGPYVDQLDLPDRAYVKHVSRLSAEEISLDPVDKNKVREFYDALRTLHESGNGHVLEDHVAVRELGEELGVNDSMFDYVFTISLLSENEQLV